MRGLSVVVGTAEVTLLDLTNAYATLGRGGVRRPPRLLISEAGEAVTVLDANTCATIDESLSSRHRRPCGMEDLAPHDVPWFMWKTGTSSRHRDAWAVGHNRRYAIGIWGGRFSGAGSPRLAGAQAAEPLLAKLFAVPFLSTGQDPPAPEPWVVERPLPPPAETDAPLRMVAPSNGAVFVAVAGQTVVHPRVNREAEVTWFLNGEHLRTEEAQRLIVEPGACKIRCVDSAGASSAVRFTVRTANAQ